MLIGQIKEGSGGKPKHLVPNLVNGLKLEP